MENKKLGIVLLVVVIVLLGFSFYSNVTEMFGFLANPLVGDGLGMICSSEQACADFCHTNMGRCARYCQENLSNKLCGRLLSNTEGSR